MARIEEVTLDTVHSDTNHLFQLLDTIDDALSDMPYERNGKRDTDLDRIASLTRIARDRAERLLGDIDNNYAELAGLEKAQAPDPFVERMAVYEQEIATYNSNEDDGDEPGGAFCDEIRSGKLAISNAEGAILALGRTKAINCIIDTEGDILVDAVIAFLEGNAS